MSSQELSRTEELTHGDAVRIKPGVMHPDFPGVPLEGWTGWIDEFGPAEEMQADFSGEPDTLCARVEWDDALLEALDDLYYDLCEREGCNPDAVILPLSDLEKVSDAQPPQQPIPREVLDRLAARDSRIRQALGVPDGVDIPYFSDEAHDRYYAYLGEHLSFPFEAAWDDIHNLHDEELRYDDPAVGDSGDPAAETSAEMHVHGPDCQHDHHEHVHGPDCDHSDGVDFVSEQYDVTVTGLIPSSAYEPAMGVMCTCLEQNRPVEADLEQLTPKDHPANAQLIEDYAYWFNVFGYSDWGFDENAGLDDEFSAAGYDDDEPPPNSDPMYAAAYKLIKQRLEEGGVEAVEALLDELKLEAKEPYVSEDSSPDAIEPIRRNHAIVGRNDPCPCGSGKKFKKCCLKAGG